MDVFDGCVRQAATAVATAEGQRHRCSAEEELLAMCWDVDRCFTFHPHIIPPDGGGGSGGGGGAGIIKDENDSGTANAATFLNTSSSSSSSSSGGGGGGKGGDGVGDGSKAKKIAAPTSFDHGGHGGRGDKRRHPLHDHKGLATWGAARALAQATAVEHV